MMITANQLVSFFMVVQLLITLQPCECRCPPSSCGDIRNISFPFRLKDDPQQCGNPLYELECQNNTTLISYLNSHKYHVKAINYQNSTIRFSDADIHTNNICSLPTVSLYQISDAHPYDPWIWNFSSDPKFYSRSRHSRPISIMRCPYRLNKTLLFSEFPTHCSNASHSHHTYIWGSGISFPEFIGDHCRIDVTVLASGLFYFQDLSNITLSQIHDALLYGLELFWLPVQCSKCGASLCVRKANSYGCFQDTFRNRLRNKLAEIRRYYSTKFYRYLRWPMLILVIIAAILFPGVSPPAKIIIGFITVLGIIIIANKHSLYTTFDWILLHPALVIGVTFAIRFIIVSPFVVWVLIYKFRRGRLSRYDGIEEYLRGDNKLVPIRYSYSDIKKMTRGFREKLGEGGYGSVYKGKLRSGDDVAVKLLGKSRANGQDFMNEIATIGRIHHVNVVRLVGYCAEKSKHALVFDFMPNSSLDKYLYSKEKMKSLSWKMKYEIAIGVARGIEYLHRGCDIQILHFDIKPHNILLDDKFTPKISDFGLAKFYSTEKNNVSLTAARGTIGYVAPELINRCIGEVSYKADVYSFGMLLIEMIGLKRDWKGNDDCSSQYFPCWIYDCFEKGKDLDIEIGESSIVNNDNEEEDSCRKIAKKMTMVALWCIQMSPCDRPSMNKVVEMLESQVERLRIPSRVIQSAQVSVNYEDQSWTTYSTQSTSFSLQDSAPTVHISVED